MKGAIPLEGGGLATGGGGSFRAGTISLESFVFKEGGEIFPGRNLGAFAVQCVREAM